MDEDSNNAVHGCAVIDGLVCAVRDDDVFSDKGCGESRAVHGHRVAQHPLVAVGDSGNNL